MLVGAYLAFGKKRKIVKNKSLIKTQAKKYKVRLTLNRGNKRVYKSEKLLKKQINNAKKKNKLFYLLIINGYYNCCRSRKFK